MLKYYCLFPDIISKVYEITQLCVKLISQSLGTEARTLLSIYNLLHIQLSNVNSTHDTRGTEQDVAMRVLLSNSRCVG